MSDGQAHVEAALALCRSAKEDLAALVGPGQAGVGEALARLEGIEETLEGLKGRFFVRTKLCLPFAARCVAEAEKLDQIVKTLHPESENDTAGLSTALSALEQAVRALDSRSAMHGMAIT